MKQNTAQNYRQRLIRVIDYIYNNLDASLDVNTLANIALMSPYHFHRIYRLMCHETVNATVRRLRLQRAAAHLIRDQRPLSEIANQLSYSSLEAFSRAFTKEFGESPSLYRRSRQDKGSHEEKPYIAMLPLAERSSSEEYQVDILHLDEIQLAAYPHHGDYLEIGAAFERLSIYASSIGLSNASSRSFGIYYNDPDSTDMTELRSHACMDINTTTKLPGENPPQKITIPKGRYASLLFKGSYAELEKPYNWLFGYWLSSSGYEAGDFPPVEEYLNNCLLYTSPSPRD